MIHSTVPWQNDCRAPPVIHSDEQAQPASGQTTLPHTRQHQPSKPATHARALASLLYTVPGGRADRVAHKPELALRGADARDMRRRQFAIGMLNDVEAGNYFKGLYWDGSGMWLIAKRLEKGRFVWPPIVDGAMTLTPAQFSVLVEAMDWRRTVAPPAPIRPMLI